MKNYLSNVSSLYLLNFSNYIIPIFAIPLLTRILDEDSFGLLVLAQSIAALVFIYFDMGNTITGLRSSARIKNNEESISVYLSNLYALKFFLLSIFIIISFLVYFFFINSYNELKFYFAGSLLGIFMGFNPVWHYQANENIKNYSILSIIIKSAGLALIFFFSKHESLALLVIIIQCLISLILCAYLLLPLLMKYDFVLPGVEEIKVTFKSYFPIFIFSMFSSFHSSASIFLLNIYMSPLILAYYSGAEKIQKFFMGFINPAERALMPIAFKSSLQNYKRDIFLKSLLTLLALALLLLFVLYINADFLVMKILGDKYIASTDILKILSFQLPLTALNRIFGIQRYLIHNKDNILTRIVVIIGFFHLIVISQLIPKYGVIGMAYSVLLTEGLFLFIFIIFFKKV